MNKSWQSWLVSRTETYSQSWLSRLDNNPHHSQSRSDLKQLRLPNFQTSFLVMNIYVSHFLTHVMITRATEASWKRDFDPMNTLQVDLHPQPSTKQYFGFVPQWMSRGRYALVSSGGVRHPLDSKQIYVRSRKQKQKRKETVKIHSQHNVMCWNEWTWINIQGGEDAYDAVAGLFPQKSH